ncbi:unnamed protein product, partial [Didymodactylos carnosus]
ETQRCDTSEIYAANMFNGKISSLFNKFKRIDVVFPSSDNYCLHEIMNNENNNTKLAVNQLKGNFVMPKSSEWQILVESNAPVIGESICRIWQASNPNGKIVLVSCPDRKILLLTRADGKQFIQNVTSLHYDINIRLIEHGLINLHGFDSECVCIKSKKSDLLFLAIANAPQFQNRLIVDILQAQGKTLDEERYNIIKKSPRKYDDISALKALLPTSDAAHQHFKRAAVAVHM